MDTDGDGRVSPTEYQDWLSYAFDGMDRDHDGVLSPAEQPGGRGEPITRDTHRARLAERFRRQDVDRSGFLDAKELAAPPQGR
jgi:Ca2+-binding EF-hand superfamily protein